MDQFGFRGSDNREDIGFPFSLWDRMGRPGPWLMGIVLRLGPG